jgi:signal peptidase II
MKLRHAILLILIALIADQTLKLYVKTHFLIGESYHVIGQWFQLNFIENDGMATGMKVHNSGWGKVALTIFRIGAVIFGTWYIPKLTRKS